LITVVREIPNRCAIRAFGTPSAASLLISAQSSKVITLQPIVECPLFTTESVQFSSAADTGGRGLGSGCGRTRAGLIDGSSHLLGRQLRELFGQPVDYLTDRSVLF
jgi:hypothetical protein